MNDMERFWRKVDASKDCWTWTAAQNGKGYGLFWFEGKMWLAHRFLYYMEHGTVPPLLDHKCNNRSCVRGCHLQQSTNRENILRGNSPSAVNATKTHCIHGHPFDVTNTKKQKYGRQCRTCANLSARKH